MYAKARQGEIREFTGIDDPYEEPIAPEITLTTIDCLPEDNARKIIRYLVQKGFLREKSDTENSPSVVPQEA